MKKANEKIEQLLDSLDKERRKFTRSNQELMQLMIDELVVLGVYPTTKIMKEHNYTPMSMVEGYGARWHEWSEPLNCPHCGADWRNFQSGPPFKREVGVYSREQDRTTEWMCPDCKKSTPRR